MSIESIDRENIYHKLTLLAGFIEHMGSQKHYHLYEDDDFFGMFLLIRDIAKEIYPEWKEEKELKQDLDMPCN